MKARLVLGLLLALALSACGDPAHEDAVSALGSEAPGVPAGPLHRPGQPCTVCHGGKGPGNMDFRLAGTLYKYPGSPEPLANAIVRFWDAHGRTAFTGTNCAGNFWLQKTDWDPEWPVFTSVEFGGVRVDMDTPIFRAGSCATCHREPASVHSLPQVYFAPVGQELSGGDCP